ncbi:NADP-dependent malic enzyme [Desulforhabdus amnigena]|jgi:malate dehydrogenase (oxaloacetate-decarboxylating)(NADP+)|uniref:Bifunctional malic enzyme oxidoreductase/phosphotransacetylase n=1 Tax=Desulforhabdus amnigena TaxID=40218 RepID=A0A9W6FRI9_9BACT|nr:NADP-dependent malic enzyme [Desulforhabdus amnigena]NLJ29662.1 NADP-dependent malic enzyme [Deltaproteobacteria bacterium]GLI33063.1 bifunctional malic enzyme oxidoreductase/phosphotransacetylase [Desulforhabdus amnigena]
MIRREDALQYHCQGRAGKIEVQPTKSCSTQRDLAMAYTPGVAEPCREIELNPDRVFEFTAKGNLVAVITNGTAVLGLGHIGPLAGKPVMEGKSVLFKRFADIDVFDIELNSTDPDEIIRVVKVLEPTFGGINLEDIKAPECFYIEERLQGILNIPVFHDDQHGTAIISGAALLNALELQGKKINEVKVVFSGAGAAGIACAELYIKLGVRRENVYLVDSKGVVYKGRKEGMNPYKERLANGSEPMSLADAMKGADVFAGVSVAGLVTREMVKSMADKPIIFAMANPDPEIGYKDALEVRSDLIMATGRSDFPNQVNNVLGFPFIFRGALDVSATAINDEMKISAVYALAALAKEDMPDSVIKAYGGQSLQFGPQYIIPKPFDPRVLIWESTAVARAAVETGVARKPIYDWDAYRQNLEGRLGRSHEIMHRIMQKAKREPKRIVFLEGGNHQVLRSCQIILDEGIASPILLGPKQEIEREIKKLRLELDGVQIIEPKTFEHLDDYAEEFYKLRCRKGITRREARHLLQHDPNYFGAMMVKVGDADGLVGGVNQHYPETIRPALQTLPLDKKTSVIAGLYMMVFQNDVMFFADTTVNIEPTSEQLAEIAICASDTVKHLDIEPRIAMLSFSNFGSTRHPHTEKVARATQIVKERRPDLAIDGEMMADTAVDPEILNSVYDFNQLKGKANVLVFPSLESGNIAYKLMARLGGAKAIGPILMGTNKAIHVLQRDCEVEDIVNTASLAVIDAQDHQCVMGEH